MNLKHKKMLLLEDDLILSSSLEELFISEGFSVDLAKDGEEALSLSYNNSYNIYIFDVDVPLINGFDLLNQLRKSNDKTPCIFLSAKVDIDSLSNGFDVGADDYVKKPFDIDKLLLRINTQIKKSYNSFNKIIEYNNLKYDIYNKIIYENNKQINLSPTQFKLFDFFMKNINKTLLKEEILFYLHDGEEGSEPSLRVQITKLKKLGLNITNQRAIGYKLEK